MTLDQLIDLLPEKIGNLAREVETASLKGQSLGVYHESQVKCLLKQYLGREKGFELYLKIMALGPQLTLHRQEVLTQLEAAESTALELRIVHQGRMPIVQVLPSIIGSAETCLIQGPTRRVFIACFQNATAFSKSTTIRLADGRFAFDLQNGEINSLPVDPTLDPVVFSCSQGQLDCIDDRRHTSRISIPEALSLFGPHSGSFGHWLIEDYLRFHTYLDCYGLRGLPVLVDSDMPRQHRESIAAFLGDDYPVVAIPRFMQVDVKRLWLVSNWIFSPKLLPSAKEPDFSSLAGTPPEAGRIYNRAFSRLECKHKFSSATERVFLARDQRRYRGIVNYDEIQVLLAKYGYQTVYPEELSFLEQFQLLRGCRFVVCQSGSAMGGLIMCSPGTKCLILSHPFMPFIGLLNQQLEELSVKIKILVGPIVECSYPYKDRSSYKIDCEMVEKEITAMEDSF